MFKTKTDHEIRKKQTFQQKTKRKQLQSYKLKKIEETFKMFKNQQKT